MKPLGKKMFKNVSFLITFVCTVFSWTALLLTCHRVKRVPDQTGLLPHEPCRLSTEASTNPWKRRSYYPNHMLLIWVIYFWLSWLMISKNPPLNTVPCDFIENTARTPHANFVTIEAICKQTFQCSVPAWGGTVCLLRIDTPTRSKIS